MPAPFRLKPGDWVANDSDDVARVKAIYDDRALDKGDVLVDLIMYSRKGTELGRVSPHCGGPRTFEPCMQASDWRRIAEPNFPIALVLVPRKGNKRSKVARFYPGDTLPDANYTPRKRASHPRPVVNDIYKRALRDIEAGHNDARQRARDALALPWGVPRSQR